MYKKGTPKVEKILVTKVYPTRLYVYVGRKKVTSNMLDSFSWANPQLQKGQEHLTRNRSSVIFKDTYRAITADDDTMQQPDRVPELNGRG